MIKRMVDIVLSFVGLLIFSPLFLLVALVALYTNSGNVFFRQQRLGKDCKLFTLYRFRISRVAPTAKPELKNTSCITFMGKILRDFNLDKLPQLINVLQGHMSLVGPRPELPEFFDYYSGEEKRLFSIKPGITSPATLYFRNQDAVTGSDDEVKAYYKNVLLPKRAKFDLAYLQRKSVFYDLKIICLSLCAISLFRSGNYSHSTLLRNRRYFILGFQLLIAVCSYYVVYHLRYDWGLSREQELRLYRTLPVAVLLQLISTTIYRLNEGYWRATEYSDLIRLLKAVVTTAALFFLVEFLFLDVAYPTGVIVIYSIFLFVFLSGLRYSTRVLREALYAVHPDAKKKILIYGVNEGSLALLRNVKSNPDTPYHVLALITAKNEGPKGSWHGCPIVASGDALDVFLEENEVAFIIDSSNSENDLGVLIRQAAAHGVRVKTMPSLDEIIEGRQQPGFLRDVRCEDLLMRREVKLDQRLLAEVYEGKRVLITGGGGSIGSELARQISHWNPACLYVLDKDETLLYEVEMDFKHKYNFSKFELIIADIQQKERLKNIMYTVKPDVVIHAAAYKHVPLMEKFPQQAFANNIIGSANLIEAAQEAGVGRFILISTDKAVASTNVMGATKALTERILFECFAPKSEMKCMAVRFGNVLGSRGSVIPLFQKQIESGGPVTVTDEKVERYFMSISEAAQLVLQAGAMGRGSELFILKMGESIRISELAKRLVEINGLRPNIDINIEFTGLRPGEKLIEELLTDIEGTQTTPHHQILVVDKSVESDNEDLIAMVHWRAQDILGADPIEIIRELQAWVEDYSPNRVGCE